MKTASRKARSAIRNAATRCLPSSNATPSTSREGNARQLSPRHQRRLTVAFMALLPLLAAACSSPEPEVEEAGALARMRAVNIARLAVINDPPLAFYDSVERKVDGYLPRLAEAVLGDLGIGEVRGKLVDRQEAIKGLASGRFDLAVLPLDEEICQHQLLTDPVYRIGNTFVTKRGNPKKVHSFQDVVRRADLTLGLVSRSSAQLTARMLGIPNDRTMIFPDLASATAALAAGRIHIVAEDALKIQLFLLRRTTPDLERVGTFKPPKSDLTPRPRTGAFLIPEGHKAFADTLNEHLRTYLRSEDHRQRSLKMGFSAEMIAPDTTVREACRS